MCSLPGNGFLLSLVIFIKDLANRILVSLVYLLSDETKSLHLEGRVSYKGGPGISPQQDLPPPPRNWKNYDIIAVKK